MTMIEKNALLARIKSSLSLVFGDRLKGVLLFGSEARGTAREDSDIDLLILLSGKIEWSKDLSKIIDVTYPLEAELTNFRPISATPVDYESFEAQEYLLYQNAKREGIPA